MNDQAKVIVDRKAKEKIQVLSDNELYRDALDFVEAQGTVEGRTQLVSLLSYTQSWDDLSRFVQHQSRRDWIGRKSYYGHYYTALDSDLRQLYQRVMAWFPPSADYQTKKEVREWNETYAIHVAREFVQHLVFENSYREKQQS